MYQHKSVLTKEVVEYLSPQPGKLYIDVTFGGGGHTRAILQAEPHCKVIGVDWDTKAIELNGPQLKEEFGDRVELVWSNFGHLTQSLKKIKVTKVDGILADFGTSQFQITSAPGFSFSKDTALDMRMSPGHYKKTAYMILRYASEEELIKIFFDYGQERHARKIARAIVATRESKEPVKTTGELARLIESVIGRTGRIHPATKVFQALRIVVNDELNNIKSLLKQSLSLLNPDGRIVCISFHSLEDVLVKQFFKEHSHEFALLTKKVVVAGSEEVSANPSSRSAKLRAAQRLHAA